MDSVTPPPPPKLLDQLRERIRYRHYSLRTEQAYVHWVKRFIFFHDKKHPKEMGKPEVEAFLSFLANEGHVAISTHRQAFSALLFLYRACAEQGWARRGESAGSIKRHWVAIASPVGGNASLPAPSIKTQGGNRKREKLRPCAIAARSISAAEEIQPLPSRNRSQARVLILRQLAGNRKLARAIL